MKVAPLLCLILAVATVNLGPSYATYVNHSCALALLRSFHPVLVCSSSLVLPRCSAPGLPQSSTPPLLCVCVLDFFRVL